MKTGDAIDEKHIQELQDKLADLKKRWSAHSVPPAILQELDELEEELSQAQSQISREANHA